MNKPITVFQTPIAWQMVVLLVQVLLSRMQIVEKQSQLVYLIG